MVVPAFADVVDLAGDDGVVGVDIPIGLPEVGAPRACDVEARRMLGPRRSSVFPAPSRDAVRMSVQTRNIVPKISEVDALMTPEMQARVVEVHPEVCFAAMAGAPMAFPKKRPEGRQERLAALGLATMPAVPRGAAADDVLDALAVQWTALRVAAGLERRLGDGAVDRRGLRMEIVY